MQETESRMSGFLGAPVQEKEMKWRGGKCLEYNFKWKNMESLYLSRGRKNLFASSFRELLQTEEGLEPFRKKLQEHSAVKIFLPSLSCMLISIVLFVDPLCSD